MTAAEGRATAMVAIGASAGGLHAVCTVLGGLPDDFGPAVVVVQHRSSDSSLLCELLAGCARLPVSEVEDKDDVEPGHVYVAPPDYHLLVEDDAFALTTDAPVRFSRPSIDVTFGSVAESYGPEAVGVVLTGANADGAWGLRRIVEAGGRGVVQDPDTAEASMMPRSAHDAVPAAPVLPLGEIPRHLAQLCSDPTARRR